VEIAGDQNRQIRQSSIYIDEIQYRDRQRLESIKKLEGVWQSHLGEGKNDFEIVRRLDCGK
jgi:hypothetical protein